MKAGQLLLLGLLALPLACVPEVALDDDTTAAADDDATVLALRALVGPASGPAA